MISLLRDNLERIAELCKNYDVLQLEVFGSATTDRFDEMNSDVDFIVDFGDYSSGDAFRYTDFALELEQLLGRKIDLMTAGPIKNPYFREAVDEQRVTIYAARDSKTAA